MVGVPGRSKACNTCRQRKVSCSLERPECRTCIKSSRVCTGYQRERIFLLDQRTACDGPKTYRKPATTDIVIAERKRKTKPIEGPATLISPTARSVYRDQILGDLLYYTLPDTHLVIEQTASESHSGSWLAMLPSLPDITIALETSILAICIARLGRLRGDQALVQESLKFYTQGLFELQKALWDPKLMHRDETIAACMALVFYEAAECPSQSITGWQSHMRGCVKMVELKGADAYKSDFGHQIFLSFRILEIQQALSERRSTYLAGKDWKDRPFKCHIKSSFHKFLDVMATLPNLIAEGYQLIEPFVTAKPVDLQATLVGILALLNHCWKLDAELRRFYTELETTNLGPIYWPNLSGVMDEEEVEGKVFPVSFHFPDLQMAHLCILYWSASAILWSGMGYSYSLLSSFEVDPGLVNLPPLEHHSDVASLAKNICQSLEYLTGPEHRGLGTTAAVFPLKVAIEALNDTPGCERELAWATAAMTKISGSGVKILDHLGVPLTDHAYLPGPGGEGAIGIVGGTIEVL